LADIQKLFFYNPPVADGIFELALVLGGTVSAGAYTAGALDFLIEALDCWEADRGDPQMPQHHVILRVITGTSGGGVNAAIAARAFNFSFPPVRQSTPDTEARTGNPFFDCWIHDLTLDRFLASGQNEHELVSILNGKAIDDGADNIVSFVAPLKQRPWLAAPLRLILTLTNLAGVPYRLDMLTGTETFVDHADYMRFAVVYGDHPAGIDFRPDELVLDFGQGARGAIGWDRFANFAKGTAAFPAGFPPREQTRPTEHYRWRVLADADAPDGYRVLKPDWDAMLTSGAASADGNYFFLVMDGGATDNEPIELGRTALCGLGSRNPRGPIIADRAVVLIDPFAGKAELGRQTAGSFADNLGSLVNALTQQTRYDSRDVSLAADPNIFSRFMLAPRQDPQSSRPAITSAGLGAFIGFACPAFMRYDYMLGRKSCRDFLFREFALAETNAKVFGAPWTQAQKQRFAQGTQLGFLPIIPLTGTAAQEQPLDSWPAGKLDPQRYRNAIEKRFQAILKVATPHPVLWQLATVVAGHISEGLVADKVISAIEQYLDEAQLK